MEIVDETRRILDDSIEEIAERYIESETLVYLKPVDWHIILENLKYIGLLENEATDFCTNEYVEGIDDWDLRFDKSYECMEYWDSPVSKHRESFIDRLRHVCEGIKPSKNRTYILE